MMHHALGEEWEHMGPEHQRSGRPLTFDELRAYRADIERIATRHGAHDVHVFGSVADGRARPDSDVDLLVQMESGRTVLDLCDLILDLEELLGRPVHVVERDRLRPQGARILKDARRL
jgi:predicted nucleotidyltransferase